MTTNYASSEGVKQCQPLIYVILLVCTWGPIGQSHAAGACEPWVAKIVSLQGQVEVVRAGKARWQRASFEETFCPGDSVRIEARSRAAIFLRNETILRLEAGTTITFEEFEPEKPSLLEVLRGAVHFISRVPRTLKIKTPFVNAAIEGTELLVRVESTETAVWVIEGRVLVSNAAGSLRLSRGQGATAEAGKAPIRRLIVRPRDAVQWALYYPPIIDYQRLSTATDPGAKIFQDAVARYRANDLPGAIAKLDTLPATDRTTQFYTLRAGFLLTVGGVDEARADIAQALRLDPDDGIAHALQSIIALAQNEKEKTLEFAHQATTLDPRSPVPYIALSYARQALFDIEEAKKSVERAIEIAPDDALAWARLAELWSSLGRQSKTLVAAKKAVELDPNLSRTQMVLGFAYLTQVKTKKSKAAFAKAIELDQADPLSRLGLGLAKIREGDLRAGGRQIEIAASLDPNNSLVRSYLGKTYFEEKRTDLDGREYAIAKELDPKDPTPYFYDAIRKQTINRPVEALHDLQKSIELNDNRAVFRSSLLLDQDLAARSASLARIYSDLGFQQRALVEGWQAVNTDPSNFSAHRFLADSYAILPRHNIARVSELLQSQLLQPINITPIQPRLAESNQFLISAGGPGALSFNEFNPIFNRNRIAFQGSGVGGGNDTYGGEGIVSGIYKRFSFSGGYTHFETDGWRDNADQNDDIANIFAQYELSYKTSIQAEYRHRDNDYGDIRQKFFKDNVFFGQKNKEEWDTFRLGGKHAFSPASVLLGSFLYQDADFRAIDNQPVVLPGVVTRLDAKNPVDSISGELQHLFSSRYFNLTTGAGFAKIDGKIDLTTETIVGPSKTFIDQDLEHTNVYGYWYLKPLRNLTFAVGASGDFTRGDNPSFDDKNNFNPKLGIIWSPFTNTTLRAAAFKVLKRTLVTDQTLEPTQVAGFNQFYDDDNGTEAWRYGGAIDQKFAQYLYGGLEFSKRDLDVLASGTTENDTVEVDWKEYLGRAYLFWTPHNWLALRAEYQYERFKRDEELTDGIRNLDTHRVPLGINFFHPSGLTTSLTGTYVYQDGKFERIVGGGGTFENDEDNFWLVDAAINYRFPKRYGRLTLGVTNLFDEDFEYFQVDRKNPDIQPDRVFFGKITLALP